MDKIKVNKKRIITGLLALTMVLLIMCIQCLCNFSHGRLDSQSIAYRWGDTKKHDQLSVFYSSDETKSKDAIESIRASVIQALSKHDSLSDREDARRFVDSYSTLSRITIISEKTSSHLKAYGVGGDFFVFHPLEIISGSYFSDETDNNEDGLVLDENAAWALFGALDVVGQIVEINGKAVPVRGVVASEKGYFSEDCGANDATVYMAYDLLNKAVKTSPEYLPITCYEIIMENPVQGFGRSILESSVGNNDKAEIVDNSARFNFENRRQIVKEYYKRVMNKKSIVYPYWENRARGYELFLVPFTLIEELAIVLLVVFVVIIFKDVWDDSKKLKMAVMSYIDNFIDGRRRKARIKREGETEKHLEKNE